MLIRPQKNYLKKSNYVSKNAEFYADFKTVEKVAKKFAHNLFNRSEISINSAFLNNLFDYNKKFGSY